VIDRASLERVTTGAVWRRGNQRATRARRAASGLSRLIREEDSSSFVDGQDATTTA